MCSPKTTQKGGPKVREDEVGGYLLKNQGIIEWKDLVEWRVCVCVSFLLSFGMSKGLPVKHWFHKSHFVPWASCPWNKRLAQKVRVLCHAWSRVFIRKSSQDTPDLYIEFSSSPKSMNSPDASWVSQWPNSNSSPGSVWIPLGSVKLICRNLKVTVSACRGQDAAWE